MRTIERSSVFKRDYKREAKGRHRKTLDEALKPVFAALAADAPLEARLRDHDLGGDWAGYRECHIKPDLLLIYRKANAYTRDWRGLAHTVSSSGERLARGMTEKIRPPDRLSLCRTADFFSGCQLICSSFPKANFNSFARN